MTIHLPEDLERYVQSQVESGHFASEDEAIAEAVRLLQQVKQRAPPRSMPLTEKAFEQQMVQSGFLAELPPDEPVSRARDFRPR